MIIATIAIKSDKIAPNKNIRGKMSRRNLELFSGPKDENAEGDAKGVKNTIEPIRAEQTKISILLLQRRICASCNEFQEREMKFIGKKNYFNCLKNLNINF